MLGYSPQSWDSSCVAALLVRPRHGCSATVPPDFCPMVALLSTGPVLSDLQGERKAEGRRPVHAFHSELEAHERFPNGRSSALLLSIKDLLKSTGGTLCRPP